MASEITLRASLSFAKSGRSAAADTGELTATMSGTKFLSTIQTVGTVAEALLLGEVPAANAHYHIENLDAANPVDLLPASGGTATTRIGAGRGACGQFGPSVAAPFVQAITAPVDIKILLVEA